MNRFIIGEKKLLAIVSLAKQRERRGYLFYGNSSVDCYGFAAW